VLQWGGIIWGSTTQNLTSLIKALAFLVLIVAAFMFGGQTPLNTSEQLIMPVGFGLVTALVISLQGVIYTYDGWNGVVYFSEEVTNPGRDIPRAMFGGVLTITAIYLLVNVALLYVLPISKIAGQDFAAGVAAQVIFGRHGNTIFLTLTILSMLSAINAYHLMATRVLFAISRDGLFVNKAAEVNKGGTPAVALFTSAAVSVLIIVFAQTFDKVIAALAFFFVANYTLSFISLFVLRRREPQKQRPYRAWGHPWTTGLVLTGSVLFLIGAIASDINEGTRYSIYALLLLAVSYPLFRLLKIANAR
jgi:APA family basic amino acid/polyamine antiporter